VKKFLIGLMAVLALAAPVTMAAPAQATTGPQQQAIGAAYDYLRVMPFSKAGLIHQLSSRYGDGFSRTTATYAVNHIRVSWKYQAVRAARQYLRIMHFSCSGLIHQLESRYGDQYLHWQAVYGAHHTRAC
jgi:hypothetical protein